MQAPRLVGGSSVSTDPADKWIAILHHDDNAAADMLATLLAVPEHLQIDTLAIVMRAFIERREAKL
jgi:hypothetical protein